MKTKLKALLVIFACFLIPLSAHAMEHKQRLTILKNKGFNPKVIYDIGAFNGGWTSYMKSLFPHSNFYLFEANPCHRKSLQNRGYPFFIAALSNYEGTGIFYRVDGTGDSLLREQTWIYEPGRCREMEVEVTTLNRLVRDHQLPLPNLVKMDVQGAEKMIIEGGKDVICNAEVIIMETKILQYNEDAPLVAEVMAFMDQLGYNVLDICEVHYLDTGELFEADFMFVKKESPLFKRGILVPRK